MGKIHPGAIHAGVLSGYKKTVRHLRYLTVLLIIYARNFLFLGDLLGYYILTLNDNLDQVNAPGQATAIKAC